MPVTPHPRRGHNPLKPHAAIPHATPDTTVSRAAHCQAHPTIRPPSAAPAHQWGETYTSRATRQGRPTAPGQARLISHPSAGTRHAPPPHPPDNQLPGHGEEPQKLNYLPFRPYIYWR
ncbi:hypothetical protein CRENBAI_001566 [Crenichthys baileyi]|uniref:Uncharacterized protein n=1 Tax=Crenichthys baileyi TaxID=28760 RepID=A0AAV9RNP8_9TELE